jgi:hypothetical protein
MVPGGKALAGAVGVAGLLLSSPRPEATAAATDPFGIEELFPGKPGGAAYFATTWENGTPREFRDAVDPMDPWLDASHGSGVYRIDGRGTLTAEGDVVRMYVHHPDRKTEWGENLELTAYITRTGESARVDYSGPQIFARTNHGTFTGPFGDEETTPCDDRGLAGKVNLNGTWAFEKETHHGDDNGYATAAARRYWDSGFPVGVPVGVKFVVRNVVDASGAPSAVKLELYVDMSSGRGGGAWTKVTEYTDEGRWAAGNTPCAPGVDAESLPVRARLLEQSETQRPELTVYFRHEYATMRYQRLSVREIDPLRGPGPATIP